MTVPEPIIRLGIIAFAVVCIGMIITHCEQQPPRETRETRETTFQQHYGLERDRYIDYSCLNGWLYAGRGNNGWLYVRDENFQPIRCTH